MGEYADFNGQRIKIGTCEDLSDLRPEQRDLVDPAVALYPLGRKPSPWLFRFPFPGEDRDAPGGFDREPGLLVWGYEPAADNVHSRIQFRAGAGILVMLPCPYSQDAKDGDLRYMFNGYRGPAHVTHMRAWEGVWVPVVRCVCRSLYSLRTVEDAGPLLAALRANAATERQGGATGLADTYDTVAARIVQGYTTPVDGPVTWVPRPTR